MNVRGGFQVYPAIDVRDGRVVRLAQGDYARETAYVGDPLERAQAYAAAGAGWLHLVDLDAARTGGYALGALLAAIKRRTGLRVQTGGGVRTRADLERLFAAGADRVVVGSVAVSDPARVADWIAVFGSARVTVAIDLRRIDGRWVAATHGWQRSAPHAVEDLLHALDAGGMRHLLCTDIARDGMLSGPNLALYAQLRAWLPNAAVQASGGVRSAADVRAAMDAGCAGIVLGKALLEQRLDLAQALAC
ncbi:MAG: 1-(5-phosphoribosyl)-5-[(5-phosphoribosylamino)methylideneamino] imidazole-4-carboxamide isomerase [Lysobacteraceae bacterium]|nr:MAG: 1-(5-phosphoribosyl)-5-[(5-phosphoribosylamino)methylideneamino] imidazole-4-carboxamide isomerase [Xanthomonadaceae bacterium]